MNSLLSGLDDVARQITGMDRKKKPKMLVVDDEPDNLDLLYRTFRRDFRVFKAESGMNALEVLSQEGEVAVIISDQRMPEMKGTEFLSKTVPDFPDTVRIILTGFTDVEDLVDAINSGQVYKYITKPWDPNELKAVVDHAAETYDLLKQRTEQLQRAEEQARLLSVIADVAQESADQNQSLGALAAALGESFSADGCILRRVDGGQLGAEGRHDQPIAIESDPLVQTALSTGKTQVWVNSATTPPPEGSEYAGAGLQVHLVLPLHYREEMIALVSLQWGRSPKPNEEEIHLIHLAAQQVVLALAALG
ncbi:MAG: response regulator [Spirulina sp. DLM2.Bin59]|nr:MAG: response regulator [Spirulina sp. DLM2.Bin59]